MTCFEPLKSKDYANITYRFFVNEKVPGTFWDSLSQAKRLLIKEAFNMDKLIFTA